MNIPDKGREKERLEEAREKKQTGDRPRSHEQLVAWEGGLEERLKFETLLIEISGRFVNLPPDQVDREIGNAQRRLCEILDLDRSTLWQLSEKEPKSLVMTHIFQFQGILPAPELWNEKGYPWTRQKLLAGETVTITKMSDLPPEAGLDRETFGLIGTKSDVIVPLSVGGGPTFGVLTFAVMREERYWPEKIVKGFQLIAQLFSSALARKCSDEVLRESEARLSLATDAAGVGLWVMEPETGYVWFTPKNRELFCLTPDEEISSERFFELIHPDDRERVYQDMQQVLQSGENLQCDYRTVLPDGTIRWIGTRGKRYLKTTGEPNRIMGVSLDITERKLTEEDLKGHLRFERLLSDLSARFVNIPPDRVDAEIGEAQRLICEFLDLDILVLWQLSSEVPDFFSATHWYSTQQDLQIRDWLHQDDYPWFKQELLSGRIVSFFSLAELPAEAARDRESFRQLGIKSNLSLPLSVGGGSMIGVFCLNSKRVERNWPDALAKRLQLVAQVFATALARKRADEALRRNEQRYRTVSDYTYDWEYWSAPDGQMLYVSPSCEGITGYSFQDFTDDPSLLRRIIIPEDQKDWDRHDHSPEKGLKEQGLQFRIRRRDGQVRWIEHVCQRVSDASGCSLGIRGSNRDITDRKELALSLEKAYDEITQLKERLEAENIYLREEVYPRNIYEHIIGQSAPLSKVLRQVEQVAPKNSTVLISGETGTGKELIAQAIHNLSKRKDRLLVKVNCASLPSTLVESELFGREKGAYTGALAKQIGRFELADHSTLFLDEISEMSQELQAKLLRVLEHGEFERLGSPKTIKVDVRLIAATNRDIAAEVHRGVFRQDLYYRLNVFPIHMPPLRERPDDIPLLVNAFVKEFSRKMDKEIDSLSKQSIKALQLYQWPGNIRELRNKIEQAVISCSGSTLELQLPRGLGSASSQTTTLEEAEYHHIMGILKTTGWRIKGPRGAAVLLGMKPSTLYSKMARLGISTRTGKGGIST